MQHLATHLGAWQLWVVDAVSNAHARPYMVPFALIVVISRPVNKDFMKMRSNLFMDGSGTKIESHVCLQSVPLSRYTVSSINFARCYCKSLTTDHLFFTLATLHRLPGPQKQLPAVS